MDRPAFDRYIGIDYSGAQMARLNEPTYTRRWAGE